VRTHSARQGASWQPGWTEEFERFYQLNHAQVRFFLRARCPDHLVDDVLQEVFSAAYTRWGEVREHAKPLAWVYRVAINKYSDAVREATAQHKLLKKLHDPVETDSAHPQGRIDSALLARQLLGRLPRSEAHAFLLFHLGWSEKETASILNVTLHTCRTYKKRARIKLREAAKELGLGDGGAA
jgi:RNA polymerase sigma factor (sigma-70 family)